MISNKYNSYRGRTPFKKFLKFLAVLLLILVILMIAALVYLRQYLVVSEDGVHLDLPFMQSNLSDTPNPPESSATLPELIVVAPTPTPTPTPEPIPVHPVLLSQDSLQDGTALLQIEAAGGDCALFDMKADNGLLNYISGNELALNAGLSAKNEAANDIIAALNEKDEFYTIARISCFKDHKITGYDPTLAIHTNSDKRWRDPDEVRWSSPTNPAVRDYLTSLCVELAELGFDEIILDNAAYPTVGNLHYIKKSAEYDPDQLSTVLGGFYAQITAALSDYDVKLSVVTTPDAISGQDSLSGQTPDNLSTFYRLWKTTESGSFSLLEKTVETP